MPRIHVAPVALLLFAGLTLGCAGLFDKKQDKGPSMDTSEEQFDDTAARKAAKEKEERRRRLAAIPKGPSHLPLTILMKADSPYGAAEIVCTEGGYRKRCNFDGNSCTLDGVPTSLTKGCQIFFQGATRASFGPVFGGQKLSCSGTGAKVMCTPY